MYLAYLFVIFSSAGIASVSIVDILYFQMAGYSLAFIGVMLAAFNFSVSAAELPFAILFDRYSNKLSLQIGNLVRMAAFALFFFNFNATTLIIAQILAGIGTAAASGTAHALILNEIKQRTPDNMSTTLGRLSYLTAGAAIVGGVIGVIAFRSFPQAIWLVAIVFFILAAFVLIPFADQSAASEKMTGKDFFHQCTKIVYLPSAGLLILTNATALAPLMLWQIKFNTISLTFLLIGFCLMKFAVILAPFLLKRLHLKASHLGWVALVNIAIIILFAYSQERWLMEVSFFAHVTFQVIQTILISGLFHSHIENSIRATGSSIISLMDSLLVMILAPLIGWIGQKFGLAAGILVSVALYAIIVVTAFMNKLNTECFCEEKELTSE